MGNNKMTSLENKISIPPTLHSLLQRLEFLSMIEPGQKICIHTKTMVDSESWYGAIYRKFNGENRNITLLYIRNTVEEVIRGFSDFPHHIYLLVNALYRAKRGIGHLLETYNDSPSTISNLRVTIKNIELQLNIHYEYLPKDMTYDKSVDERIDMINDDAFKRSSPIDIPDNNSLRNHIRNTPPKSWRTQRRELIDESE